MSTASWPLGVCALPTAQPNYARGVTYPDYVYEILDHAGVCYNRVDLQNLQEALPGLRMLVTVGDVPFSDDLKTALYQWINAGGNWISVTGICGMEDALQVADEPPAYACWEGEKGILGEGYLRPVDGGHPVVDHIKLPLHFYNGVPAVLKGAKAIATTVDAHQGGNERLAVSESCYGNGRCMFIAPDLTGSVVRIQQGVAITRDCVPANDGSVPTDGVLKTDDGMVLDWIFDREPVEEAPGLRMFKQPFADQWKELLLRSIFYLAEGSGVALPVLWLYPNNLPAMLHISHDTDCNVPERALGMIDELAAAGVHSTWCVIPPGYEPDIIEAIRKAGHELAFHYDSMSDGTVWCEKEFDEQLKQITELFGGVGPVTNKNHYLRWQGDTEFYDWCLSRGIRFDESKGPSKVGAVGFGFGTCQPYFPVDPEGKKLDVLELPTLTQDMIVFAPTAVAQPMLTAARIHHGIAHFLFHPHHIATDGVADAFHAVVNKARELGMGSMTASQINDWERARRAVKWTNYEQTPNSIGVTINSDEPLENATILWLSSGAKVNVDGQDAQLQEVERWGFKFQSVVTNLEKGSSHTFGVGASGK